jgi:hypothetical protein
MSFSKSTLIAAGLTLAAVTGAYAQGSTLGAGPESSDVNLFDRTGFYMDETGKMHAIGSSKKHVNAKGHAMIMKYGKKLPPHTMIYRVGNDMYMMEGKALEDDTKQSLTDHAKGWVGDD